MFAYQPAAPPKTSRLLVPNNSFMTARAIGYIALGWSFCLGIGCLFFTERVPQVRTILSKVPIIGERYASYREESDDE